MPGRCMRPFTQETEEDHRELASIRGDEGPRKSTNRESLSKRGSRPLTMKPRCRCLKMALAMLELGGVEDARRAPLDVGFGSVH